MKHEMSEAFEIIVNGIFETIKAKRYVDAREMLLEHNEVDIAEILEEVIEELGVEAALIVFRMLPKAISMEVFSYLPSEDQKSIISAITDSELTYILEELRFDDMIDVIEELPATLVSKILAKSSKEERKLINTVAVFFVISVIAVLASPFIHRSWFLIASIICCAEMEWSPKTYSLMAVSESAAVAIPVPWMPKLLYFPPS